AVRITELSDTDLMTIPHPEQFPLVAARNQDVADHLRVTGVVSPDVNRTVPVNALGGGRVLEIRAKLGDDVRKGQTLVIISSPDMSGALSDYQKARADAALVRKQLERAQLLFQHGAIARKDIDIAENADQDAAVTVQTTQERVHMLGGDVEHPAPYIELKAPISGTIVGQNVTPAAGVKSPDNAPDLFTIADLSRVWVLCDVYENDLAAVHLGAVAMVHLNAYPDRVFQGRVGNISKVLDPNTRTASVRIELANSGGLMRQGMFATVDLVSPTRHPRIVLPTTALLRLHDADWAFVKAEGNTVRRTHVQTGLTLSGGDSVQEVVRGVPPGSQVIRDALAFSRAVEQQ
ncbi:MAG TPA: efflux RND transporter periplasmic adaptor subunit, partial [Gemmatimonadaceae bacterium]|nr:efflux RND transporter periplasmic adaptor subunit [Gemmatimonadaceae bacterium]